MQLLRSLKEEWAYHLATLAILAGVILTLISGLKLCLTSCSEAHNYRLFGLPFESIGGIYFAALFFCHFMAHQSLIYRLWSQLLIACGIGAESFFILLQKLQIGTWCPVCLAIAASIGCAGIAYLFWEKKLQQEGLMRGWLQAGVLMSVLTIGFTITFLGVTKIDQLEAAEEEIKEKIKFGNKNSPIEVYVFTDWACPACRSVEPAIEAMAPKILQQAQLTFVDTVVHPETLNYAPYNIALMAQVKPMYFKVRETLNALSLKNKKPTDEDIVKAVEPLGVQFHELPFEDVTAAMRYFDELVEKYKITSTPTVAIINSESKQSKKLTGANQITEANVLKEIDNLK